MSVTGEMQAKVLQDIIDERKVRNVVATAVVEGDSHEENKSKIRSLVTDNASVMRKTWRILIRSNKGFIAYGCITHCYNLLNKDIYKLTLFKAVMKKCRTLTTWFSRHGQDLSIFR